MENNENMGESSQNESKNTAPSEKSSHENEGEKKQPAAGADNDQLMGILSYLGILVIIPIAVAKDSEFAMYHANQGLILFIAEVILFGIGMIPILGWIISFFGWIAAVVFAIIGIMNAAGKKKKPLPIIGGYQILK